MSDTMTLCAVNSLTASQSPTGKAVPAGETFDAPRGRAQELIRLGKATASAGRPAPAERKGA